MSGRDRVFDHARRAQVPAPDGYEAVFHTGFNAHIGPIFARYPDPTSKEPSHLIFQVEDHHLNGAGFVHGGVLMSLADIAIGSTVNAALEDATTSTVSLNCDFLAPGKPGDRIEMEAEITRRTRSVVFALGRVFAAREGERVALLTANGVWKIIGVH